MYAKSYEIKAFPISVDRNIVAYKDAAGKYYTDSEDGRDVVKGYDGKSITEQTLTTLLSMFLGTGLSGFVISDSHVDYEISGVGSQPKYTSISFMLGGYFFELTDVNLISFTTTAFPTDRTLYAVLNINSSPDSPYKYLYADDELSGASDTTPEYCGVKFTNTSTEITDSDIYLKLLDASGNIPIESYYKFRARDIKDIDAGTI